MVANLQGRVNGLAAILTAENAEIAEKCKYNEGTRRRCPVGNPRSQALATHDDFLRAICEEPDDDAPRLVFADWLEERGDPRGEFIRLQCELERLDEDDPTRAESENRCQLLLAMHKSAWLGELPQRVREYRFRRGFVHWVQLSAKNLLVHGEQLFEMAPIRQVTINDINSYLDEVAACPHLARLDGLDIKPEFSWRQTDYPASLLDDIGLLRLISNSVNRLEGLVGLDLGYNQLGGRTLFALSQFALENLQRLDLSHNAIEGKEGFQNLADGPYRLTEMALNNNPFGSFPARRLAEAEGFGKLRVLRLDSTNVTTAAVEELVAGAHLNALAQLYLDGNPLTDQAVTALCRSPKAAGLTVLSLNSIGGNGDGSGRAVADSSHLGSLRRLSLRHNHLGPAGADALASSALPSLRLLDLRDNAIGDAGVAAIAQSSNFANLTTLLLAENSIGDAGALALVESPCLERVVEIRIGNNPIGSAARHALQSRFGHRVIFDS